MQLNPWDADNVVGGATVYPVAKSPLIFGPDDVMQPGTPIVQSFLPKPTVLPMKPTVGSTGVTTITKPQILPTIDVTAPGGHLLDITPKVVITESRIADVPWWVWALGAVAVYMLFGKRRRG